MLTFRYPASRGPSIFLDKSEDRRASARRVTFRALERIKLFGLKLFENFEKRTHRKTTKFSNGCENVFKNGKTRSKLSHKGMK